MANIDDATPRTRAALTRSQQQLARYADGKPASQSLNRQAVLTEDEYIQGLERIIARDFFPAVSDRIARQEEENEILLGFHSHDPDIIERSVRGMERLVGQNPSRSSVQLAQDVTPREGFSETPIPSSTLQAVKARLRYDPSLSLDDFQAKYTSEDNASFADIVNTENDARKSKYAWAYRAEQASNDRSRRAIEARTQLVDLARRLTEGDGEIRLIEGAEPGRPGARMLIEGRKSLPGDKESMNFAKRRLLASSTGKDRLMIESAPEKTGELSVADREEELQIAMLEGKADAEAHLAEAQTAGTTQSWKFTARNNLYFSPDANVPIHQASRDAHRKQGTAAIDEMGINEPKGIRYSSTRIFTQEALEEAARKAGIPPSPSHSNIAAAVNGTPYHGRPDVGMTPRVQGYSFVDEMPSPSVSNLGASGINSLMTFGTLASTPVALRDPNPEDPAFVEGPFKIPATSRREQISHKLASKAARSLQQRQGSGLARAGLGLRMVHPVSQSPRSTPLRSVKLDIDGSGRTPGRDAYLSPAAKTLLGRTAINKRSLDVTPSAPPDGSIDANAQGMERYKRARW